MPKRSGLHGARRPSTVDPSIKQVRGLPVPGTGPYQTTRLAPNSDMSWVRRWGRVRCVPTPGREADGSPARGNVSRSGAAALIWRRNVAQSVGGRR